MSAERLLLRSCRSPRTRTGPGPPGGDRTALAKDHVFGEIALEVGNIAWCEEHIERQLTFVVFRFLYSHRLAIALFQLAGQVVIVLAFRSWPE